MEYDDDFDIIVRSAWYFEPGTYVGRTSLGRPSSPLRHSPTLGDFGDLSPVSRQENRPGTSSGRPFPTSTMKSDFNYKPRPASSGRVGKNCLIIIE